jgi:hypothetical protein
MNKRIHFPSPLEKVPEGRMRSERKPTTRIQITTLYCSYYLSMYFLRINVECMTQLVIFDLDGTLLDTIEDFSNCMQ